MTYAKGPWWFGISGSPEKGPVPFDYSGPGYYDNAAIFDADGNEIVGCDEYHVFDDPESIQLMCAAPMLLEGAIDAMDALKLLRVGAASQMPDALKVIDSHIDEISYAIAKATQQEGRK